MRFSVQKQCLERFKQQKAKDFTLSAQSNPGTDSGPAGSAVNGNFTGNENQTTGNTSEPPVGLKRARKDDGKNPLAKLYTWEILLPFVFPHNLC